MRLNTLRVGVGSEVEYELELSFSVLLGDVEILGGEPAVDTLYIGVSEIEGIVLALEAEAAQLLTRPCYIPLPWAVFVPAARSEQVVARGVESD